MRPRSRRFHARAARADSRREALVVQRSRLPFRRFLVSPLQTLIWALTTATGIVNGLDLLLTERTIVNARFVDDSLKEARSFPSRSGAQIQIVAGFRITGIRTQKILLCHQFSIAVN